MPDPTTRFTDRVANYVKYRPRYPQAIVGFLREACALTESSVVADVGSGTGFLAELFLENGNTVFGIEPNDAMREAGEGYLAAFPRFHSVAGTAEATTLPDQSVDFVAAGQAFHWFDSERARAEFARILRPEGWVALVWNGREAGTPFLDGYEALLQRYATDYTEVDHHRFDEARLRPFFAEGSFHEAHFPNRQDFDFDGLKGRLLSSSYAPAEGHPRHEPMLDALQELFDAHQEGGQVAFLYDTVVYYGHVKVMNDER